MSFYAIIEQIQEFVGRFFGKRARYVYLSSSTLFQLPTMLLRLVLVCIHTYLEPRELRPQEHQHRQHHSFDSQFRMLRTHNHSLAKFYLYRLAAYPSAIQKE